MSYSIFYNTQYVKLENSFIPMILAGDSNCYTVGPHPKRARDWQIFSYLLNSNDDLFLGKSNFFATEQEIISAIDADIENTLATKSGPDKYDNNRMITREEVAKQYGWHTSLAIRGTTFTLTAKKYRSFITNGIKNALTIEELDKIGINLNFFNDTYHKDRLTVPAPDSYQILSDEDFNTELKIWTDWAEKCIIIRRDGTEEKANFSLSFDSGEDIVTKSLQRYRRELRRQNAKPTVNVEVEHYFVLKNENGYLVRYTRYGYKYGYAASYSSKKYQFEKDAKRYIKTLEKNGKTDNWEIERINKPTTFKVSGRGITPYQAWTEGNKQAWTEPLI